MTDFVLQTGDRGSLKWFIRETSRIERGEKISNGIAEKIWAEIAERYLDRQSGEYKAELQAAIHADVRASLGDKATWLFPFFQFLWRELAPWPEIIRRDIDFLKRIRSELGEAAPSLLHKLNVLAGQGERLIGPVGASGFAPDLVAIPAGGLCPYGFDAMRTPLTKLHYARLVGAMNGEPMVEADPHLLGPWVWNDVSNTRSEFQRDRYPQVHAEIRSILESCEHAAHKSGYLWRVPTIAEWLRLAGCESQRYPWGANPPTPKHANLNFGRTTQIRSVGSYPLGRSKFGIDDCCGNIHELAWSAKTERLPDDSRLMGGCFLTRSEMPHSSCRRIRLLSKREPDSRRNVGLRLVRIPDDANESRWQSLQNLVKTLEVDSDDEKDIV